MDSDNDYFSDDDYLTDEHNIDYDYEEDKMAKFNDEYPADYDSEEEMKIRELIFKKSISCSFADIENNYIKEDKVKTMKEKKSISLNDLNTMVAKLEDERKPKKFISKRSEEKKKEMGIEKQVKLVIRKLNPRLPPYLLSEEYKNSIKNNNVSFTLEDFPSL
jgi:hypothetical protein